jgi:hypothetical protein
LDDALGTNRKLPQSPRDKIHPSIPLASRNVPKGVPSGMKSKAEINPALEETWDEPPSRNQSLKEAPEKVAAHPVSTGWCTTRSSPQQRMNTVAPPAISKAARTYKEHPNSEGRGATTITLRDLIPNNREISSRIKYLYKEISQGDWNLVYDLEYLTDMWRDGWTGE